MNKYFNTPDLTTAATIVTVLNMEPDHLDRSDPSRIRFVFQNTESLDQLLDQYWRKQLKVEPISFAMAQKFLKQQLYNR